MGALHSMLYSQLTTSSEELYYLFQIILFCIFTLCIGLVGQNVDTYFTDYYYTEYFILYRYLYIFKCPCIFHYVRKLYCK